jgi:Zn-dependent protease with chaperone function
MLGTSTRRGKFQLFGPACLALSFVSLPMAAQDGMRIDFSEVPTVHFPAGDLIVSAYPAFEDYSFMLFDICDALGLAIGTGECLIYPMNASLGGNALATIVDGNKLIVYDRELSLQVGSGGAEMIIAHELGHHQCRHLGKSVGPPQDRPTLLPGPRQSSWGNRWRRRWRLFMFLMRGPL